MTELIYLAQTAEPQTTDEKREWYAARLREARAKGSKWERCSYHPDNDNMLLVEAWDKRPKHEGPLRWQLEAAQETP